MSYEFANCYNTTHELEFINKLAKSGNRIALRNYIANIDMRQWPASMDRDRCLGYAKAALADITPLVQ